MGFKLYSEPIQHSTGITGGKKSINLTGDGRLKPTAIETCFFF